MAKKNCTIYAYLNDFAACKVTERAALVSFNKFKAVAAELGLHLADKKCVPPATSMDWLGCHLDSHPRSVAIPDQKMEEILEECKLWLTRKHANKNMVQQIAGRLIYISGCIPPGRKFTA